MVNIRKGPLTARVSWGCFKTDYEGQGWELYEGAGFMPQKRDGGPLVNLPSPDQEDAPEDEIDQEDDEETEENEPEEGEPEEEEDLLERPLSSLSMTELKQVAELKGVDVEGLRSKRDIRLAIREAEEG